MQKQQTKSQQTVDRYSKSIEQMKAIGEYFTCKDAIKICRANNTNNSIFTYLKELRFIAKRGNSKKDYFFKDYFLNVPVENIATKCIFLSRKRVLQSYNKHKVIKEKVKHNNTIINKPYWISEQLGLKGHSIVIKNQNNQPVYSESINGVWRLSTYNKDGILIKEEDAINGVKHFDYKINIDLIEMSRKLNIPLHILKSKLMN